MREAAFAEFHQVCHEISQAFLVLLLAAFSKSSGACCLKMQGGRYVWFQLFKVDINIRQESNDYLPVEPYNSA